MFSTIRNYHDLPPFNFFLSAQVADVKVAEETVEPDKDTDQHHKHLLLIIKIPFNYVIDINHYLQC